MAKTIAVLIILGLAACGPTPAPGSSAETAEIVKLCKGGGGVVHYHGRDWFRPHSTFWMGSGDFSDDMPIAGAIGNICP